MIDALLSDEQKKLRDEVREFVNWVPRDLIINMDADNIQYPTDYVKEAARRKLIGLRFSPADGGRGLRWKDEIIALEEVGVLGSSLACLYSLVSIVGEALHVFGTGDQKKKYLVPVLRGERFVAEGLTEPRGGSDFFGVATKAEKKGSVYVLNGQKRFVVGAEGADTFLIYARTGAGARDISAFVVEKDYGVKTEYLYGLLGTRGGGAGRLLFKDVKVPAENIILGENRGAEIFNQMMIPERMTSAAGALGLARAALEIATRYSTKRKAFGQPIRSFEAVSFRIADSITQLDAARGIVSNAAEAVDTYGSTGYTRRLVSEAKKFATETALDVTNNAMQIMGGIGYTNVYPIERMLRDARLMTIWTGTNDIMNLIIQHEYYKQVLGGESATRDLEDDAEEAHARDEKIYE